MEEEKKKQEAYPAHSKQISEVKEHFQTDLEKGLSSEEAKRRLD